MLGKPYRRIAAGWVEHPQPWELEHAMLGRISLPLNLQGNKHHAFHATLSTLRQAAKVAAKELPVAAEGNQQRLHPVTQEPKGRDSARCDTLPAAPCHDRVSDSSLTRNGPLCSGLASV